MDHRAIDLQEQNKTQNQRSFTASLHYELIFIYNFINFSDKWISIVIDDISISIHITENLKTWNLILLLLCEFIKYVQIAYKENNIGYFREVILANFTDQVLQRRKRGKMYNFSKGRSPDEYLSIYVNDACAPTQLSRCTDLEFNHAFLLDHNLNKPNFSTLGLQLCYIMSSYL